jgi:lipid-A-disaccharide synthase
MGALFLDVARSLWRAKLIEAAIIPAANPTCQSLLAALLSERLPETDGLPIRLIDGDSRGAISAADVALTASGTATLEAALLQTPMVVAHRMGALSWLVLSRLVQVDHVALPNILLGERRVPELLQGEATILNIHNALEPLLSSPQTRSAMTAPFVGLGAGLRCNFGQRVSEGLLNLAFGEVRST